MTVTLSTAVVAALDAAKSLVEQGHCHERARVRLPNGRVCYCAMGALAAVCHTLRIYECRCAFQHCPHVISGTDIFNAAHDALRSALPGRWHGGSVADFNDAVARNQVAHLYARAIDTVRQVAA